MSSVRTPGIYTVEKDAFPNSVVDVATAVPAFIGYTEKAECHGASVQLKPVRIGSLAEFHQHFGAGPQASHVRFSLKPATAEDDTALSPSFNTPLGPRDQEPLRTAHGAYRLAQTHGWYLLHAAMRLFFLNGGGPCFVVSVGGYALAADGHGPAAGRQIDAAHLQAGLKALEAEREPTIIVVPEAVLLPKPDCDALQVHMLAHCGATMKNRVALIDVWEGYLPRAGSPLGDFIELAREAVGVNHLSYGAAYYPWLHTTVLQEDELSFLNIHPDSRAQLMDCISDELRTQGLPVATLAARLAEASRITTTVQDAHTDARLLCARLAGISPFYNMLRLEMTRRLNLLPPSAAMAGVFTAVDNTRGVWKAPANVSLNGVLAPAVPISHEDQEDLNVPVRGKSINALRSFIGQGTLVWGARTLDSNSLDWRYINVRRTMIMLEESIQLAARAFVFESHVPSTWVTLKAMISNFLTGIWKRGGLAGAVPEDAFSVHLGLGETMTAEDILDGLLRVTVLVAISRPAEFIEITLTQRMPKA